MMSKLLEVIGSAVFSRIGELQNFWTSTSRSFNFLSQVLKMGWLKAVLALMPFNFGRIFCVVEIDIVN